MKVKKFHLPRVLTVCITLLSVFLYVKAGDEYSIALCIYCMVAFIISFVCFLLVNNIKNYFNFVTLFSVAYLFVYFVYPIFIYPVNRNSIFVFAFGFNERVINKSTLLALIGYTFFILGSTSVRRIRFIMSNRKFCNKNKLQVPLNTKKSTSLIITVLAIGVLFVNFFKVFIMHYTSYGNNVNEAIGIWNYMTIITHGILVGSVTIVFQIILSEGKSFGESLRKNFLFWVAYSLNIVFILYSGARTEPLYLGLILLAGYFLTKGGVRIDKFIVIAVIGFSILSIVGRIRSEGWTSSRDIFSFATDLIVNNYTMYYCYDYVQNYGHVFFPLIGSLMRGIPFLLGLITRLFSIPTSHFSSALFFTYSILGKIDSLGMGSNIISSLYLSCGFIGVIFGMYLLGTLVKRFINPDIDNIWNMAIYFELIGVSVYLVRADYFYPVGNIIITIFFVWLLRKIA